MYFVSEINNTDDSAFCFRLRPKIDANNTDTEINNTDDNAFCFRLRPNFVICSERL